MYQYAAAEKNTKLLSETARLLLRAYEKNPADTDVIVTLGHLYYDIGYFDNDNKGFVKAREFYQKILAKTPDNIEVRTDYGLTYFLQDPPEYDKAVAEFQRSLETNPKHAKSLQFLIQTLLKQQKTGEAEIYLARLKEVDPKTPSLSDIQKQMAQEENSRSQ
jgi:tetratricopeptide (TPR) repeat protein